MKAVGVDWNVSVEDAGDILCISLHGVDARAQADSAFDHLREALLDYAGSVEAIVLDGPSPIFPSGDPLDEVAEARSSGGARLGGGVAAFALAIDGAIAGTRLVLGGAARSFFGRNL